MKWYHWLILVVVFYALGCAISDEQIDRIAGTTELVVKGMVDGGIKVASGSLPFLELIGGGGLGGILGALGGRTMRKILKAIQKDSKNHPLVQPD